MVARRQICCVAPPTVGLNNAFRHVYGNGQALRAHCGSKLLAAEIFDDRPAFSARRTSASSGFGLAGLRRRRTEPRGSLFEFSSRPRWRARLIARFNLASMEPAYA